MVAIVARDVRTLGPMAASENWQSLAVPEGFRVWTDDYSNIIDPIMRRFRKPWTTRPPGRPAAVQVFLCATSRGMLLGWERKDKIAPRPSTIPPGSRE